SGSPRVSKATLLTFNLNQVGSRASDSRAAATSTASPKSAPGPASPTRTTGADTQTAATVSPPGRWTPALTEQSPGVRWETLSTQRGTDSVSTRAADPPAVSGSRVPTGTDARSSAGESTLARQSRCSPRRT